MALAMLAFAAVLLAAVLGGLDFYLQPVFEVHSSGAILITGASTGVGFDVAQELAARGFTVFATVRKEADFPALQAAGCTPLLVNMEDDASVSHVVAEVAAWTQQHGQPLVALVNNAGMSFSMPIEFAPMDKVRHLFEVNLFGLMRLTQLALPLLRASRGRLVLVSSIAGLISTPYHGTYSASKAALEALGDAMRLELQPHGVAVALVEPGYVQTAIGEKGLSADQPFRRATPEQIAVYSHFFASHERLRRASFEGAPYPNTTTTPAILDAVLSPRPRPRYIVAGVGRVPGWLATALTNALPTRLRDRLIERTRR